MTHHQTRETELRGSIRAVIEIGYQRMHRLENDSLGGGICKAFTRRLNQLEKQLRATCSEEDLRTLGKEVTEVMSKLLCISLIRYWYLQCVRYRLLYGVLA